jgi:GntR family transcriptional regulator
MSDNTQAVTFAIPTVGPQPKPRHASVRDALRRDIERGVYGLGSNLPTEAALCDAFGASRHTVREALKGLVELGLIERRQGAGSVVVSAEASPAFVHSAKSLSELWSYTRATKIVARNAGLERLTEQEAEVVGAPAGSRWLRIQAERWTASESEIVCQVTLYAHVRFSAILQGLGESTDPVYAIIEARTGEKVAEAVQLISACSMPRAAATLLGRKKGDPALKIVRRYLDAGGSTMLAAVSIHPGDSFQHTLRLRREHEAG